MGHKEKMLGVSKNKPCPICGKPDWCLVAPDGATAICVRIEEGSVKVCGDAGYLHRGFAPFTAGTDVAKHTPVGRCAAPDKMDHSRIDFDDHVSQCQEKLTDDKLAELSETLGLSEQSLKRLNFGWDGTAFTTPMSNDFGKTLGVRRRFVNGKKGSRKGSQMGLFVPDDLSHDDPLLICEGPTDTAAALDLGFDAIGRPNCNSKVAMTVEATKGWTERVIIADNDETGKAGAEKLADAFMQSGLQVKIVTPPDPIKDLREWMASGLTSDQLQTAITLAPLTAVTRRTEQRPTETWQSAELNFATNAATEEGANAPWDLPAPLGTFDLPEFPLEAFPEPLCVLCEFCAAVAESFQVPVDMPAMLLLALGGAVLAKKVVVHVQGDHWEPVNLFVVVALPPGNRKSGVFRVVTKPLSDFEQQEAKRLAPLIEQNRNQRKVLDEALKHTQGKAARAEKPMERQKHMDRLRELLEEQKNLETITSPQFIGDDATPESVALLLSDNDERFALLSPEGDVFELMAGRYSSNNAANLGVYLKGHAGDEIRVNRARQDFTPRFVHNPALTIGVAVQPDVLRGLTHKKGFRGRGLLGRFLYSIPQSRLGYRKINARPVDPGLAQLYQDLMLDTLGLQPATDTQGDPCPHTLTVSKEALAEIDRFAIEVEKQLAPSGEFASMGDWAGKLVGAVCRIAGIFHGLMTAASGRPAETQINAETMLGAIAIGEYLIAHAKAAFFEMGSDPTIDTSRKILDWVFAQQRAEITKRDLFNALRGAIQKVSELDEPLQLLISHGYIREATVEQNGPGRKLSQNYEVNPHWLAHNTQNTQNRQNGHVDLNSAYSAQFAREGTL